MLRRISRIYPCYVLVTTMALAVYLWHPDLVNAAETDRPDVLASFLMLPQKGLPLLLVGWTLTFVMYFYLVFAVCMLWPRRRLPALLSIWAFLLIAIQPLGAAFTAANPYLDLTTSPYSIEFIAGCALGLLIEGGWACPPWAGAIAGSLGLAASVVAGDGDSRPGKWIAAGCATLACAGLTVAAVGTELRGRWTAPRRLVTVGDAAFSIYLVHVPLLKVFAMIAAVVVGYLTDNWLVHALVVVVAVVASGAAGFAFHRLVERPLVRLVHDHMPRPRRSESPRVLPLDRAVEK